MTIRRQTAGNIGYQAGIMINSLTQILDNAKAEREEAEAGLRKDGFLQEFGAMTAAAEKAGVSPASFRVQSNRLLSKYGIAAGAEFDETMKLYGDGWETRETERTKRENKAGENKPYLDAAQAEARALRETITDPSLMELGKRTKAPSGDFTALRDLRPARRAYDRRDRTVDAAMAGIEGFDAEIGDAEDIAPIILAPAKRAALELAAVHLEKGDTTKARQILMRAAVDKDDIKGYGLELNPKEPEKAAQSEWERRYARWQKAPEGSDEKKHLAVKLGLVAKPTGPKDASDQTRREMNNLKDAVNLTFKRYNADEVTLPEGMDPNSWQAMTYVMKAQPNLRKTIQAKIDAGDSQARFDLAVIDEAIRKAQEIALPGFEQSSAAQDRAASEELRRLPEPIGLMPGHSQDPIGLFK